MDGWMDDLRFYVLFNSISVILGQWVGRQPVRRYLDKQNLTNSNKTVHGDKAQLPSISHQGPAT